MRPVTPLALENATGHMARASLPGFADLMMGNPDVGSGDPSPTDHC